MRRLPAWALVLPLAAGPIPEAAHAGSLRVLPQRVELDTRSTEVVRVRNDGSDPLSLEVQALAWRQDASGADVTTPSADLVYYPKLVTLPGRGEALVRIAYRGPAPAEREIPYRLRLSEIPVDAPDERVRFVVTMTLPVFVSDAAVEARPELERLELGADVLRVVLRNAGSGHVRVTELEIRLLDAGGELLFEGRTPGWYVLPGARRRFEIPAGGLPCARVARAVVLAHLAGDEIRQWPAPLDPARCSSS